jgi:hypothetical protein
VRLQGRCRVGADHQCFDVHSHGWHRLRLTSASRRIVAPCFKTRSRTTQHHGSPRQAIPRPGHQRPARDASAFFWWWPPCWPPYGSRRGRPSRAAPAVRARPRFDVGVQGCKRRPSSGCRELRACQLQRTRRRTSTRTRGPPVDVHAAALPAYSMPANRVQCQHGPVVVGCGPEIHAAKHGGPVAQAVTPEEPCAPRDAPGRPRIFILLFTPPRKKAPAFPLEP